MSGPSASGSTIPAPDHGRPYVIRTLGVGMMGESERPEYGSCEVRSSRRDGVVHASVAGELDGWTVPLLERELAQDAGTLVLDLAECTFVDSTALGLLAATHTRLEESGGRLELVGAGLAVRRALQLTRLDGVLTIRETRAGDV